MPQKGVIRAGAIHYGKASGDSTVSAPGRAIFSSEDPPIDVRLTTTGGICDPPRPRVTTVDRMDSVGLTQWIGQEPYTMQVGVRIDGYPSTNIERDIKDLESLAEVHAGRFEPPIVTVDGAVPKPHPNLRWRILDLGAPEVEYLPSGDRCRYVTVVSLIQRVTDTVLVESLKETSASKGIKARKTTVRQGEDFLYDVARRLYKDPSRASDLATANGFHLGKKLTPGLLLRYP